MPRSKILLAFTLLCLVASVFILFFTEGRSNGSYLAECKVLLERREWQELKILAEEWTGTAADPGEPLTFQAEAELQLGNVQTAIDLLLDVPAGSRKRYRSLIAASELQFDRQNDPVAGINTLNRIVEIRPSSTTAHQRIIFFHAITLQRQSMLGAIYRAIKDRAEPPDAYVYLILAGKLSFSNGFTKNSEWLASNPGSELFEVARTIQLIDYTMLAESEASKKLLPGYWETFHELRGRYPRNMALAAFELEQTEKSHDLTRAKQILDAVPEQEYDSVLWRWRGWLQLQHGHIDDAVSSFQKSLELFRLDWLTWHHLAACRRRQGNLDAAEEASQIALVGKQLRKDALQLNDASGIQVATLRTLATYAASCGDDGVALAILRRLNSGQTPN